MTKNMQKIPILGSKAIAVNAKIPIIMPSYCSKSMTVSLTIPVIKHILAIDLISFVINQMLTLYLLKFFANSLEPDQARRCRPDLGPNCLTL